MRTLLTVLAILCLHLTALQAQIDPLNFELGILDLNTNQIPLGPPTKSYASPDGLFFTTEEEDGKTGIVYYYDGNEVKEVYRRAINFGQVEFFFVTSFNGGTMIIEAVTTADTGYYTHFYDEQAGDFNSLLNLGGGVLNNYYLEGDRLYVQTGNARLAITDGSVGGTVILGTNNFLRTGRFYPYQGKVLFYAGDKLYLTDGTVAGTQVPGSFFSNGFENAFLVGDNYFYEDNVDLWKFDLTTNTSVKLTNTGEAAEFVPQDISHITPTANGAQFIANSDAGGWEIWQSDGTVAGTQSLDLVSGPGSFVSNGTRTFVLNDRLFFVGAQGPATIYSSDGTAEGIIAEIEVDEAVTSLGSWRLVFIGEAENGDGYFAANTFSPSLTHIYTKPVTAERSGFAGGFNEDINPEAGILFTENGIYLNDYDYLYYVNAEENSLKNVGEASVENFLGNVGETAIFSQDFTGFPGVPDLEPYTATPESGSINVLGELYPGRTSSSPQPLFERDGKHFFLARNPETFNGIYETDGTPEGTFLAEDISMQNYGNAFGPLMTAGGKIYFEMNEELWVSTGTVATSQPLEVPGYFWELVGAKADTVYFESSSYQKLLRTDGTAAGTEEINLRNVIPNLIEAFSFELIGDKLYGWTKERNEDDTFLTQLVALNTSDLSVSGTYFPTTGIGTSALGSITQSDGIIYAKRFATTGEDALFSLNPATGETQLLDSDDEATVYYPPPFIGDSNRLIYTKGEGAASIISLYTLDDGMPLKIFEDIPYSNTNALFDFDGYSLLFTTQRIIRINADNSTEVILEDSALGNFTRFSDGRVLFSRTSNFPDIYRETWVTDGTVAGTERFYAGAPGINSQEPYTFIRPFLFLREKFLEDLIITLYNYEVDAIGGPPPPNPASYSSGVPVTYQDKFYYVSYNTEVGQEIHYLEFDYPQGATVNAYHDINGNSIQDPGEPGINNLSFLATAEDDEERIFTNETGYGAFVLDPETDYSISALPSDCWELTSSPDNALLNFSPGEDINLDYGFSVRTGNPDLKVLLTSAQPRCGFTVPFWLNVMNTGCQNLSGNAALELPEGVTFVSGDGNPTLEGNVVTWNYTDLAPEAVNRINLLLTLPGEEAVGEIIEITTTAVALGEAQDTLAETSFGYAEVLSCAIDPNDKQVLPTRPEPSNSNYTQFDETLIYTIRFQNTGTDTAFNVLLKDRLATRLDYATFKPLTASHEFHASIKDRNVEFFFENIMLPDSSVNEPLSHGFVTFEIKLDGERTIGALIRNEADIYFDYNDAIRTNEVRSRIVEFLDEDQDGFFFYDECDDQNPGINPDRYDIPGNGIDENCDDTDTPVSTTTPLTGQLAIFPNPAHQQLNLSFSDNRELVAQLYDLLGREQAQLVFRSNGDLQLTQLPAGTYLLKVTDAAKGETSIRRVIRR